MKLEFLQLIGKYSNINLHENPSSRNGALQCGQTDRHRDRDKWRG